MTGRLAVLAAVDGSADAASAAAEVATPVAEIVDNGPAEMVDEVNVGTTVVGRYTVVWAMLADATGVIEVAIGSAN